MKWKFLLLSAFLGFLTSLVILALSFLGAVFLNLPFLPFDLFDWLTRHLPGSLVEAGIRSMVSVIMALRLGPTDTTAKLAEQVQALALVVLAGMVFGLVLAWISLRRPDWVERAGLLGGFLLWIGTIFAEAAIPQPPTSLVVGLAWLLLLLEVWGWGLAWFVTTAARREAGKVPQPGAAQAVQAEPGDRNGQATPDLTRRAFLGLAIASLASLFVIAAGLGKYSRTKATVSMPVTSGAGPTPEPDLPYGPQYTTGPAASPSPAALAARIPPAPGTRPEITSPDQFYRIDINLRPPEVDASTWKLALKGMVATPMSWTIDQIRAMPAASQAVTIECISNPLGGDLISGNYWTGVRFKDLLAQAGLSPQAKFINLQAVDGFYETVPVEEAMDDRTLLVYAMNGQPLLVQHGFPLRIFIPNHYGMKQPKWITEMEATAMPSAGYWVERGWNERANPQTTSIIDTLKVDPAEVQKSGIFPLGGIAYAGARGIQKVEVQIDRGDWQPAELVSPPVSPLMWVQWRFDWKASAGDHIVAVRATDGTGTVQNPDSGGPPPAGSTGIVAANIKV